MYLHLPQNPFLSSKYMYVAYCLLLSYTYISHIPPFLPLFNLKKKKKKLSFQRNILQNLFYILRITCVIPVCYQAKQQAHMMPPNSVFTVTSTFNIPSFIIIPGLLLRPVFTDNIIIRDAFRSTHFHFHNHKNNIQWYIYIFS